jgi:predicted flap endonuclease-1-like 5' DNA nuclease
MDIQDIEGIGETYAKKLNNVGVKTMDDLMAKGGTPTERVNLAAAVGLTENQILEWVNRADLQRVKGIGSEYADLLETAGVDTVAELAQRNAEFLADRLRAVNQVKQITPNVPGTQLIEEWILKAKSLPKAVEY